MNQVVLKKTLTVLASALFAAAPAFADMLDFAVPGPSSASWPFTGFSPVSPSVPHGSATANGLSRESSSSDVFTTGAFLGRSAETLNGPYVLGASAPGLYVITGCIRRRAVSCSEVTLFSGAFDGLEVLWTPTKRGHGRFVGFGVTGTINSAPAAALGILPGTYIAVATFNLTASPVAGDTVMDGDLTLASTGTTAVTEPASLALLGIVLVVAAGLRKYRT
jgi:hypothetical protein